jgi:hypothetical protein
VRRLCNGITTLVAQPLKLDAHSVKLDRDALILAFTWLLIAAMATTLILLSPP